MSGSSTGQDQIFTVGSYGGFDPVIVACGAATGCADKVILPWMQAALKDGYF